MLVYFRERAGCEVELLALLRPVKTRAKPLLMLEDLSTDDDSAASSEEDLSEESQEPSAAAEPAAEPSLLETLWASAVPAAAARSSRQGRVGRRGFHVQAEVGIDVFSYLTVSTPFSGFLQDHTAERSTLSINSIGSYTPSN